MHNREMAILSTYFNEKPELLRYYGDNSPKNYKEIILNKLDDLNDVQFKEFCAALAVYPSLQALGLQR